MSRSPLSAPGKDDDDSWGKLASDLLGIQLDVDADLDFPEPEPVKPSVAAPVVVESAKSPEPVSEKEDVAPETVEPTPQTSDDEFWKTLEEWDWDESGNKPKLPRRSVSSSMEDESPAPDRAPRGAARSDRGERGGDRRGGRSRGGRDRDQDSDSRRRPPAETRAVETRAEVPRPAEFPVAPEADAVVENDRPRRRPEPRRRPAEAADEAPRGRSRPEAPRREPPRRPPTKPRPVGDGFGAGLENEDLLDDPWGPTDDEPLATEVVGAAGFDDFEDEEPAPRRAREPVAGEVGDDEQAPRRRRRRGGRGRSRRPEDAAEVAETPDDHEDAELLEPGDEPLPERLEDDDEDHGEPGEEQRPRPRRRRRGGRGGRRPAGVEETAGEPAPPREVRPPRPRPVDEDAELDEGDEEEEDEAPVVRVKYDNIPTWEEAISVMLVRREQGPRSRGPQRPQQRRGDW